VAGQIRSSSGGFVFPDGTVQTTASAGGGGGGTITGVTAGTGLTGGGTAGSVTLGLNTGTGLSIVNNNVAVNYGSTNGTAVQGNTSITVSAGDGMSGGGPLTLGAGGTLTVTNADKGSSQNIFKNVANGAGTAQFSAGSNNDTVRFAGTGGATISFNAGAKQITVDASSITSSQWTTNGANINYAPTGNVGIGAPSPSYKLDVGGQVRSATGGFVFPDGTVQTTAATGNGTITGVTAGAGLTGGGTGGSVTLTNTDTGSSQNIFKNIANAAGANQFSASSNNDVIRFEGSGGTNISFDVAAKKVTVDSSGITSSQWNTSGANISYAAGGNVGIGTASITAGYKLDVSGDLKVSGTGNINANGTIEAGNIKAKYQDVAEWVPSSEQLSAGTVVVLDATKSNQVTSSSTAYDTRVAGVVSEQPGIVLGEKSDAKVLVATTGRVRVKVDASKVPIHVGDLLVTSDIRGLAMKSEPVNLGGVQIHRPGTLIGKALESLDRGGGSVLVLLSLQ